MIRFLRYRLRSLSIAFLVLTLGLPLGAAQSSLQNTYQKVKQERQTWDNYFLLTKQQMLEHKLDIQPERSWNNPTPQIKNTDWSAFDTGRLWGLEREAKELTSLITGAASVQKSLAQDTYNLTTAERALEQNARAAIIRYQRTVGTFPDSWKDFEPYAEERWGSITINGKSIPLHELDDLIEYTPHRSPDCKVSPSNPPCDYTHFDIRIRKSFPSGSFTLDQIQEVSTPSHDYVALMKEEGLTAVPASDLFSIIPHDVFVAHFSDPKAYQKTFQLMNNPFAQSLKTLPIPSLSDFEARVADRLGISNPQKLMGLTAEWAFVSPDLDFLNRTDFALIIRFKQKLTQNIAEALLSKDAHAATKDDYWIIATSPDFLQTLTQDPSTALDQSTDFQYANAVLGGEQNGTIFLSDAFIRKQVSPAYRIKALRKRTTRARLQNLQYMVWAYKDLTGKYPPSLHPIQEKGFASFGPFLNLDEYSVTAKGEVIHQTWGSLKAMTPIHQVSIGSISQREKNWYETGKDQYESFYQAFFDPIAIGITADESSLHFRTLIIPLADIPGYEILRRILEAPSSSEINPPQGDPSALLELQVNIRRGLMYFLRETVGRELSYEFNQPLRQLSDEEIVEKVIQIFQREGIPISLKAEEILSLNQGTFRLVLGGREGLEFPNLIAFDAYASLQLPPGAKAKALTQQIFSIFSEVLQEELRYGANFFPSVDPFEDTYQGKTYHVYPFAFFNVYLTHLENTIYVTVNPYTLHKIIEGSSEQADYQFKSLETSFIPSPLLGLIDLKAYEPFLTDQTTSSKTFYSQIFDITQEDQYLSSRGMDTTGFYHLPPTLSGWDIRKEEKDDTWYLIHQKQRIRLSDLDTRPKQQRWYYHRFPSSLSQVERQLDPILSGRRGHNTSGQQKALKAWKTFYLRKEANDAEKPSSFSHSHVGIAFAFTEHGADIQIHAQKPSHRHQKSHKAKGSSSSSKENQQIILLAVGPLLIIILLVLTFRRPKKDTLS